MYVPSAVLILVLGDYGVDWSRSVVVVVLLFLFLFSFVFLLLSLLARNLTPFTIHAAPYNMSVGTNKKKTGIIHTTSHHTFYHISHLVSINSVAV